MRTKQLIKLGLVSLPLAAGLALTGCGGSSINGGNAVATNPSDPTIFGINTTQYNTLTNLADETSSFADSAGNAIATGTQDSSANVIFQIADGIGTAENSTIALGFAAGLATGNPSDQVFANPMTPGEQVTFGAYIANGQNSTGTLNQVQSVGLTSADPQWGHLGTLPLTFQTNSTFSGALGDDDYSTSPFTAPFTTSGIHSVVASVTDTATTTSTTFNTIVLPPADNMGAVVAQAIVSVTFSGSNTPTVVEASPYGAIVYGAPAFVPSQATITGEVTPANPYIPNISEALAAFGYAATTPTAGMTDQNGVAVVFAAPGTQTLTFTGTDPVTGAAATGSAKVTVVAGKITSTMIGPDGTAVPLQITLTDTAAAFRARPEKKVLHHPFGNRI